MRAYRVACSRLTDRYLLQQGTALLVAVPAALLLRPSEPRAAAAVILGLLVFWALNTWRAHRAWCALSQSWACAEADAAMRHRSPA